MSQKAEKTARRVRMLRARDGDNCGVCGLLMRFDQVRRVAGHGPARIDVTIDHIIPKCEGGTSRYWNLRLTHQQCNAARHKPGFREEEMRDEMASRIQVWLNAGPRIASKNRIGYVVQLDCERGLEKQAV